MRLKYNNTKNMNKLKITNIVLGSLLILITILFFVSISSAWFTDEKDINRDLQMGNIELNFGTDNGEQTANFPLNALIVEGQPIFKNDIVIHNAGNQGMFLRVKMEFTGTNSASLNSKIKPFTDNSYMWEQMGTYFYLTNLKGEPLQVTENASYQFLSGASLLYPVGTNDLHLNFSAKAIQSASFSPKTSKDVGVEMGDAIRDYHKLTINTTDTSNTKTEQSLWTNLKYVISPEIKNGYDIYIDNQKTNTKEITLTGNLTVEVRYERKKFTITAQVDGGNGKISYEITKDKATQQNEVYYGGTVVFTATPNDSAKYKVDTFTITGGTGTQVDNKFTVSNIQSNIIVKVKFKQAIQVCNISYVGEDRGMDEGWYGNVDYVGHDTPNNPIIQINSGSDLIFTFFGNYTTGYMQNLNNVEGKFESIINLGKVDAAAFWPSVEQFKDKIANKWKIVNVQSDLIVHRPAEAQRYNARHPDDWHESYIGESFAYSGIDYVFTIKESHSVYKDLRLTSITCNGVNLQEGVDYYKSKSYLDERDCESMEYIIYGKSVKGEIYYSAAITFCFEGNTLVLARENEKDVMKKIKDIKKGDIVYSYNERFDIFELKEVLATKKGINKISVLKIGNEEIKCTSGHPFLTEKRGYIPAKELEIGERVKTKNGYEIVKSFENNLYEDYVYNFTVRDNHNYIVTNSFLITHNAPDASCD